MKLDAKIPAGPLAQKWDQAQVRNEAGQPGQQAQIRRHRRRHRPGGRLGRRESLAELGYNVKAFCYQDSPRRAHSIAAQGGINAAKNYQNDGDSVYRLFYDTIKGGDFRAREANVYRLAQVSVNIIDQCVAQGVPFAREYGGLLANRSFGGAQVSRTFYARGQTGQQLLLGAYQALCRQIGWAVKMFPRTEMLDLVVVNGHAKGIVTRDLVTGEISAHAADAVVLATGGYGNVFYLSTNAKGCNVTATWRAYKRARPSPIPATRRFIPTCIPVSGDHQSKLTLMSESLRNDGRVWVPKKKGDNAAARRHSRGERDYYLERKYPSFGNLAPRDISSRAAKEVCDEGRGVGPGGLGVYLDFADAIKRIGEAACASATAICLTCTKRSPARTPTSADAHLSGGALHHGRAVGGLQFDEHVPGLFVLGEANFSDHGANRLGASALMQGWRTAISSLPYTIGNYFATAKEPKPKAARDQPEFKKAWPMMQELTRKLLAINGKRTVNSFHKELGKL
jgi:succinate dehydrogenase / fumarate reductase, flavoprotein subunit